LSYRSYDDGQVYQEKITDDFTALAVFIDFVNNSDDETFKAGITDRLNVDEFLRAMASTWSAASGTDTGSSPTTTTTFSRTSPRAASRTSPGISTRVTGWTTGSALTCSERTGRRATIKDGATTASAAAGFDCETPSQL